MLEGYQLIIAGAVLLVGGSVLYLSAQRSLSAEELATVKKAVANPSPVVTAFFMAFLVLSMAVLVMFSLLSGKTSKVAVLAPALVCFATYAKTLASIRSISLSQSWRGRYLLGLGLTCVGISLGFAGLASKYLFQ